MNDAKFLGLCIVFAAILISGTIVWSTNVTEAALAGQPTKEASVPVTAAPTVETVTIQGPVQLAPLAAPIPVTISTTEDAPLNVKDVSEKKWNR